MKQTNLKSKIARRFLCMILCLMLICGSVFMTSCNEESAEAGEQSTEKETLEIQPVYELNENGKVNVLVFNTDVPMGTKISKKMLDTVEMDPNNLPRNVVSDFGMVTGKYTKKDFYSGDYVIASRVSDTRPVILDEQTIKQKIDKSDNDYIVVTDYISANTGEDLYSSLQSLITKNPGRTIYFPDGEYVISRSLVTSSEPKSSVSFYFSSGAILKASDDWSEEDGKNALIALGAVKMVNDIRTPGSNFYVMGGIFDGNGKADGISIDAGRETLIKGVVIVNVRYGVYIKEGTNNTSSDSDVDDVTIVCNGRPSSVGIKAIGVDNTFTDIRISNAQTGFQIRGGDFVTNCTVEGIKTTSMEVIGFACNYSSAYFSNCTAVDCTIAYDLKGARGFFKQCTALWPSNLGDKHVAFRATALKSSIMGCRAEFVDNNATNVFLEATNTEGTGGIVSPVFDVSLVSASDKTQAYLYPDTDIINIGK